MNTNNDGVFFFLFFVTAVIGLSSLVLLALVISFICERVRLLMRLRRFLFSLHRSRELHDAYLDMATKAAITKLLGGKDIEPARILGQIGRNVRRHRPGSTRHPWRAGPNTRKA